MFRGFGWFQWAVIGVMAFFVGVMVAVIWIAQMRPSEHSAMIESYFPDPQSEVVDEEIIEEEFEEQQQEEVVR